MDLGGHVASFGPLVGIGEVVLFGRSGESKVSQFDLNLRVVLGNQHIFQF